MGTGVELTLPRRRLGAGRGFALFGLLALYLAQLPDEARAALWLDGWFDPATRVHTLAGARAVAAAVIAGLGVAFDTSGEDGGRGRRSESEWIASSMAAAAACALVLAGSGSELLGLAIGHIALACVAAMVAVIGTARLVGGLGARAAWCVTALAILAVGGWFWSEALGWRGVGGELARVFTGDAFAPAPGRLWVAGTALLVARATRLAGLGLVASVVAVGPMIGVSVLAAASGPGSATRIGIVAAACAISLWTGDPRLGPGVFTAGAALVGVWGRGLLGTRPGS
ncbi:MAG: hypothetical protein ACYTFV_11180 [Planctomycetota bacterium]